MPKQLRPRSKFASDADNLIEWASRAFAVIILMLLPGLAGFYLDGQFGTRWFAPIGFFFGMVLGMVSLIAIVKRMELEKKAQREASDSNSAKSEFTESSDDAAPPENEDAGSSSTGGYAGKDGAGID